MKDKAPHANQTSRPVCNASPHPALDRMRFLFTMSDIEGRKEQRRIGILLAGHSAFVTLSACALNETDKSHRIRIGKLQSARHFVKTFQGPDLVEPDGIEPTTSCLQSTRSPN
jgi:hypothetical protein